MYSKYGISTVSFKLVINLPRSVCIVHSGDLQTNIRFQGPGQIESYLRLRTMCGKITCALLRGRCRYSLNDINVLIVRLLII